MVINEFLADNEWAEADPNGEYDDWIELYNPSPNSVDLSGMYLTDNFNNLTKWQIPEGTIIDAHGFVCFWADEQEEQGANHTNFKLEKDGEEIALVDTDGISVIDSIVFGSQSLDQSYIRYPDGANDWYLTNFISFNTNNWVARSQKPKFSRPGGAFTTPFWLELTSDVPGTKIYYNIDNAPSAYTLYTGPILINSTTWVSVGYISRNHTPLQPPATMTMMATSTSSLQRSTP